MLLRDFISKCKEKDFSNFNSKVWVDYGNLSKHFTDENIPGKVCEEWKNFDTSILNKVVWNLPEKLENSSDLNNKVKYENCIVLVDGVYNEKISNINKTEKLKIIPLEDYINQNDEAKNLVYNSPSKYCENRLSGKKDTKPITLLSINTILNKGIAIISDNKNFSKESIKILNLTTTKNNTFLNPYVLVVCNENTKSKIVDISNNPDNNWINPFYEFYAKEGASLKFSSIQSNTLNNFTTSSLNFHMYKNSDLDISIFNRENTKKDFRIFLKGKGAKAVINGLLVSSKEKTSDVFCKIVHSAQDTKSDQNWRLVSADNSKTSVIGKILVEKGAKKSDAKFFSKSLIMNSKAASFARPELEIFEGDIGCAHGASFGEIDKDRLFYLQSRGIEKKAAIKMLLVSFINETKMSESLVNSTIFNEIDYYL